MHQENADLEIFDRRLNALEEGSSNIFLISKHLIREECEILETQLKYLRKLCADTNHNDSKEGCCEYCGEKLGKKSFWR